MHHNTDETRDPMNRYPEELMRRFELYFKSSNTQKNLSVRQVKANHIGKLISVKGVVTRATEVKPMISVATYTCDICGSETYQPVGLTKAISSTHASPSRLLRRHLCHLLCVLVKIV